MENGSNSIQTAISATSNPEVVEMAKKLAEYGLAISAPHMHDTNGSFQKIPSGTIAYEENLEVSFKKASDVNIQDSVPVMWRWNGESNSIEVTARCGLECKLK